MVTTTHGQHLVMGSSSPGDADGGHGQPFLRQSTPSPLQERRHGHPPEASERFRAAPDDGEHRRAVLGRDGVDAAVRTVVHVAGRHDT